MNRSRLLLLPALAALLLRGCSGEEQQPNFKLCQSTYALCTTAPCTPVEGKAKTVTCACEVKTGYSLGQEDCQKVEDTAEGRQIRSRYYPVKSYAVCTNDRPWAWCLDKPCTIDKDDPSRASCLCGTVKEQGPYVIVTETYTDTTCTTGIISSATVKDATAATDFLKTNKDLKPFEVKVLNPQ
jgi:hypothetical protein